MSLKIAHEVSAFLFKNSITMAQSLPLLRLPADGTPIGIAAMTEIKPPIPGPSLHRQLGALVRHGFVVRKQPGNRQTAVYALTAAGRRLMVKLGEPAPVTTGDAA